MKIGLLAVLLLGCAACASPTSEDASDGAQAVSAGSPSAALAPGQYRKTVPETEGGGTLTLTAADASSFDFTLRATYVTGEGAHAEGTATRSAPGVYGYALDDECTLTFRVEGARIAVATTGCTNTAEYFDGTYERR